MRFLLIYTRTHTPTPPTHPLTLFRTVFKRETKQGFLALSISLPFVKGVCVENMQ
jgi:hypothetical protein